MKHKAKLFNILLAAAVVIGSIAVPAAAGDGSSLLLAFPGAEGAGKYATGGRGGKVRIVSNLNDSGEGSFREAVSHSNSIVVFAVGGTINLKSDVIVKGNVTVAGQTAPGGKGITLRNGKIGMGGDNIIIRFVSSRPGEKGKESDYDAWGGNKGSNSIIDHCSIGFANDEQFGLYSSNMNQTVQYTIIGPSNCVSYHSKGAHGFGAMFGKGQNSWHHNLLCHSLSRNFRGKVEKGSEPMDFTNNVIYNWGYQTAYGTLGHINYVNNYLKAGPSTKSGYRFLNNSSGSSRENYRFYIDGNTMRKKDNSYYNKDIENKNQWLGVSGFSEGTYRVNSPFKVPAVNGEDASTVNSLDTAEDAYLKVVRYSGAGVHPVDNTVSGYNYEKDTSRPLIDARVLYETYTGTGSLTGGRKFSSYSDFTNSDSALAKAIKTYGIQYMDYDQFYPKEEKQTITDSDKDGMDDVWEKERGLNVGKDDSRDDYLGQGYTNIEYYINDLTVDAFPEGVVTVSEPVGIYEGYAPAREDAAAISLPTQPIISPAELPLPVVGSKNGSAISWSSASELIEIENNVVTVVNRPSGDDESASLVAEIVNKDYTMKKYFTVTVKSTTTRWIASESDKNKGAGSRLMDGLYPLETLSAGKGMTSYTINGTDYSETYNYYVSGDNNGTWDKENGVATGTGFKYTPNENGFVTAYITSLGTAAADGKQESVKTAYIVKEGEKSQDDCLASVSAAGSNAMLTAPVEAGSTYYIYVAGSKGRFVGITFGHTGAEEMWKASESVPLGGSLMKNLTVNDDMTFVPKSSRSIGDVDNFIGYISSGNNPKDNGKSGSSLTYKPEFDGVITVYYKVNSGKEFIINDYNGNVMASYKNEPAIDPDSTPDPEAEYPSEYMSTSAELKAGTTYYIYTAGSKGEYYGISFVPTSAGGSSQQPDPTPTPTDPAPTPTDPTPTEPAPELPKVVFRQNGSEVSAFGGGEIEFCISGSELEPCDIILAGYNEYGIINCIATVSLKGEKEQTVKMNLPDETVSIKAYIWNSVNGMRPITETPPEIKRANN